MKAHILYTLTCLAHRNKSNLDDIIDAYNIGHTSGRIDQLDKQIKSQIEEHSNYWGIDEIAERIGAN